MLTSFILDVEPADGSGLKPVEFFSTKAFEYHLGWKSPTVTKLINSKSFPESPYIREIKGKAGYMRLYTQQMIDEVTELVETHYPPYYRGRDPLIKAAYLLEMEEYKKQVALLQAKWLEVDYLALAPAKPRPFKKRRPRKTVEE